MNANARPKSTPTNGSAAAHGCEGPEKRGQNAIDVESIVKKYGEFTAVDGVTFHGLRHAHASWLLAGGADLQVVKERLGHASIMTTQRYLHTLPEADESAVEAFSRIRNRGASSARPRRGRSA